MTLQVTHDNLGVPPRNEGTPRDVPRTATQRNFGETTAQMQLEASRVSDGAASLPHAPSAASSLAASASLQPLSQSPSLGRFSSVPTAMASLADAQSLSPMLKQAPSAANWSESPSAPATRVAGPHGLIHVGATARSSLPSVMQTPQQCSGLLSLQSSVNVLTPPISNTHTPRAAAGAGFMGVGTHALAQFASIPATPATGAVDATKRVRWDADTDMDKRKTDDESDGPTPPASATTAGPVELPMLDERRPNYGGTRGKGAYQSNDEEAKSADGDGSESDDSRQRSAIEFNSFAAMDSSFVSQTSSHGGGPGGAAQYNTLGKAVFHIFKGNVGAGVFLLPTYYQDTGYMLGMIVVLLLGLLMIDCALSLLHAKHTINHAEIKTYPAVVNYVLGSWFRYFTDFALIFTQFGFCVMYIQYASSTFASLFPFPHSYAVCIAVTVVVVTPMTFLSNKMNILAYASMLAGLFVAIVLAGTTAVDVEHLSTNGVAAGVLAFLPSARILVFLSGHMFSLEGIGIVLPVENSLAPESRARFGVLVKYTLMCIVTLYIAFGVLGYCAYGENLHTSVVLALPPGLMKKSLQCLLGLSLIFGYPIQYVPAIQLVDRAINVSIRRDRTKAYLVRIVLNVLFGVFALFIGGDALNIFASFLGAFAGVHLMITIPALLSLQIDNAMDPARETLSYKEYMLKLFQGPYTWRRLRCYAYLVLALIVWIGGLYFTFDSVFGGVATDSEDDISSSAASSSSSSP